MSGRGVAATLALVCLPLLGTGLAAVQERPDGVVQVRRGPFRATLPVAGVFRQDDPVVLRWQPEALTEPVEVEELVAAGPVTRGQVLLRLTSPEGNERIRRAELDLRLRRLGLQRRREEVRRSGESVEQQRWRARQDLAAAEFAHLLQTTIDVPQQLQGSLDRVEASDQDMADAEEEYRILVAMYEADGVLETNERMDMESRRRSLDRSKLTRPHLLQRHELLTKVTLPRALAESELRVRTARQALALVEAGAPLRARQAHLELAREEQAVARQERELEQLHQDREALTVRAPEDGVAIAGHYQGRWTDLGDAEERFRPGTRIPSGQVLFTLVQSAPALVATAVPEDRLGQVPVGLAAVLVPTAAPQVTLPATVTQVSPVAADGKVAVLLQASVRHRKLFPGSTCQVELLLRDEAQALTVPAGAVAREGGQAWVDAWKDGVVTRRVVEAGLTSGGRTEILGGLAEGESVLATVSATGSS